MLTWSDRRVLEQLTALRFLEIEVCDSDRDFNPFEWGGRSRQETAADLGARIDELLREAHRRKLDMFPSLDTAEREYVEIWG